MSRRVQSSDVLDANAITKGELRVEIIGRYRPTGPNRWDDWELSTDDIGEEITIPGRNKVQVEPFGAKAEIRLRHRKGRTVYRTRWLPEARDLEALETGKWGVQEAESATFIEKVFRTGPENDPRDDVIEYFFDVLAESWSADEGIGVTAMLVQKLRGL